MFSDYYQKTVNPCPAPFTTYESIFVFLLFHLIRTNHRIMSVRLSYPDTLLFLYFFPLFSCNKIESKLVRQ